MKKGIIVLVIVMVSVFAVSASAQMGFGMGGYGRGHGMHMGGMYNNGYNGQQFFNGCPWMGENWNNNMNVVINSADDALNAVSKYIGDAGLSGYKAVEAQAIQTRNAAVQNYVVKATDAGNNEFLFTVSPNGFVRGPMRGNINIQNFNTAP